MTLKYMKVSEKSNFYVQLKSNPILLKRKPGLFDSYNYLSLSDVIGVIIKSYH